MNTEDNMSSIAHAINPGCSAHPDTVPALKFKKLSEDAVIPSYKTVGAAGMDIVATESVNVHPGEVAVIKTDLAVEIPEGYELQVRPRSGLATQGLTVVNSPGTIDSDYRGEIKVIVANLMRSRELSSVISPFCVSIKKGDRIAQLVLAKTPKLPIVEVTKLSDTDRGAGGLGSTGK